MFCSSREGGGGRQAGREWSGVEAEAAAEAAAEAEAEAEACVPTFIHDALQSVKNILYL